VFGCDIHRAWEPPIALRRPGRDLRLAVVTWPQMAATDPSSGHVSGMCLPLDQLGVLRESPQIGCRFRCRSVHDRCRHG
jgi:hypothetical protein